MRQKLYWSLFLFWGAILLLGCNATVEPDEVSSGESLKSQSDSSSKLSSDIDPESGSRLPIRKREDMKPEDQEVYDRFLGDDATSLAGIRGPKNLRLYSPQAGFHLSRSNRILEPRHRSRRKRTRRPVRPHQRPVWCRPHSRFLAATLACHRPG